MVPIINILYAFDARRYYANVRTEETSWDAPTTGWLKLFSEDENKYYYSNVETEETQWEVPTAPVRPAALSRKVTHMPEGWRKLFTDEGLGYYVDPDNKSQWEKPPGNDLD